MFEFKIYGEIVPFNDAYITEKGNKGGYCTLAFVQEKLAEAKGKPITVRVNSFGGDVTTGFQIYYELRRYAKENNVKVTTVGEAYVSSIATVIFLAGDDRVLTGIVAPFFHNAWSEFAGDSGSMFKQAEELKKANHELAKLYSSITTLSYDQALQLMGNDTSLTIEESINIKFAHRYEEAVRPKAFKQLFKKPIINNVKKSEMNNKPKKGIAWAIQTIAKAITINAKKMNTANSQELDFPDLNDEDTPDVGDMATLDGAPAHGEIAMPSGDIYVFEEGELVQIKEDAEEREDMSEELAAANAKIAEYEQLIHASATHIQALSTELTTYKEMQSAKPKVKATSAMKNDANKKPEAKGSRAKNALSFAFNPVKK